MGGSLPIVLFVLILISFQYLLEVHMGSSTSIHDAEMGVSPIDSTPKKSSSTEFLGKAAPLQLAALGLPLLTANVFAGGVLLLLALLLLFLFKGGPFIKDSSIST